MHTFQSSYKVLSDRDINKITTAKQQYTIFMGDYWTKPLSKIQKIKFNKFFHQKIEISKFKAKN